MSLLLPHFLWGLLGLIPLALVYLIKVHPVRKKTSAWFLWEGIFQERRAASLLQKLRDWLSLLLMALAFILLVLALAQPVLSKNDAVGRLVLVVDNSLSMNADGRMEAARRAAQGWVRSLPAGGRAAVFSLSGELLSTTGFTGNRRELMRGLDAVRGTDVPFNAEALNHFVRDESMVDGQRIILFSDGCFVGALPDGIELVKVGAPADNAGITAFDVRRIPGADQPLGIFFRIFSGAAKPVELDVVLSQGTAENLQRVFPLTLQPGLNEPVITTIPNGLPGCWILALEHTDALERDNTAYAVVPEIVPVRVAVRAPETHLFWQLCVEAFGGGVNGLLLSDTEPDLELFRGNSATSSAPHVAVFAPAGSSPFWSGISGETLEATVRVMLPSHPLMRYANLDGRVVGGIRQIKPPKQAVVLAETDEGIPLIYKTSQENQTAYVLNFDPAQNDFFLTPLYPVLVWSLASELMGLEQDHPPSIRAGGVAQMPAAMQTGEVRPPDGEVFHYANGRIGPLTQFGFYEVSSGEKQRVVACSTPPVAESNLDNSDVVGVSDAARAAGFPLAEWFLVAALLLFALECVLYHRRKVG